MRPEPLDALVMRPPAHAPADYDELLDGKLGSTLAWPLSCAKYKIVRPLGQGTFSTCFLAQRSSAWEPTQLVALKVTPRYTDPAKVPAREIEIAMLLVRQPASKLGPSASRHALLTSLLRSLVRAAGLPIRCQAPRALLPRHSHLLSPCSGPRRVRLQLARALPDGFCARRGIAFLASSTGAELRPSAGPGARLHPLAPNHPPRHQARQLPDPAPSAGRGTRGAAALRALRLGRRKVPPKGRRPVLLLVLLLPPLPGA